MEDILERVINEVVIKSYDGDIDPSTGLYEGYGEAVLDNGSSYSGDFSKGLFHGQGKFTWEDGSSFEGGFERGKIHGEGVFTWSNGSRYEGLVEDGVRHGVGQFTGLDGQVYDGEWMDGKRHGHGKMHYNADKSVLYIGEWRDGLRHGHGLMRYASGNSYEGEWEFDQKCGFGAMIWKDVDEVYMGRWKDDLPHGFGEHIWGDNGTRPSFKKQMCNIYRGDWLAGERSGLGTFFYADGSQYTGEWVHNQKDGSGVYIKSDGSMHYGYYSQDRMLLTSAVPRESDAVTPQVRISIADVMERFFYKQWNDKAVLDATATIERLLLRYNSNLRTVTRRYIELANVRRKKDTLVPLQSGSKIDTIFHSQRNIHKRFFTATLREFWRFAREFSLIGPYLSCYDISIALQHLLQNRTAIARATQLDQEATAVRLAKEAEVAAQLALQQAAADAATAAAIAKKGKKKRALMKNASSGLDLASLSSSSSVASTSVASVAVQALMSSTTPAPASSTSSSTVLPSKKPTKSSISKTSTRGPVGPDSLLPALSHSPIPLKARYAAFVDNLYDESDTHPGPLIAFDPRNPLRDYEFVELYVRCAIESHVHASVIDGTFDGEDVDVADVVYKSLADQIYARSTDMSSVPDVYVDMYASSVQSALHKHDAYIRQLWGVAKGLLQDGPPAQGVAASVEEATVGAVLRLFLSMSQPSEESLWKSALIVNNCSTSDILRIANKIPESVVDIDADPSLLMAIVSSRLIYEDFIELLVRLIRSDLWIHASEKERHMKSSPAFPASTESPTGELAAEEERVTDTDPIEKVELTSEQLLTLRLHHLFAELKSCSTVPSK